MLIDIELRRHVIGIRLPGRSLEGTQMGTIHLIALHQADMLQMAGNGLNSFYGVHKHGQIRRHQLRPGGPVLISGIEDMRYLRQSPQLQPGFFRVKQIGGDIADTACVHSAPAGNSDNIPFRKRCQVPDQIAADHTVRSNNQCGFALCSIIRIHKQVLSFNLGMPSLCLLGQSVNSTHFGVI
ncbi:hypothetical protein D3C75_781760 [compost metagenome]